MACRDALCGPVRALRNRALLLRQPLPLSHEVVEQSTRISNARLAETAERIPGAINAYGDDRMNRSVLGEYPDIKLGERCVTRVSVKLNVLVPGAEGEKVRRKISARSSPGEHRPDRLAIVDVKRDGVLDSSSSSAPSQVGCC